MVQSPELILEHVFKQTFTLEVDDVNDSTLETANSPNTYSVKNVLIMKKIPLHNFDGFMHFEPS